MTFNIKNFEIGGKKTFIIAEIGNNHNGDFQLAKDMIDAAKLAGADCVKFQMRHMSEVYRSKSLAKDGEDLGTEYVIDLLRKFELSQEEHKKLFEYCNDIDILYMCTPWDLKSVDILEAFGVKAYKVASADLTNIPLISKLSETKKPLILSTGMSLENEIRLTSDFLNSKKVKYAFLHCNSTYPAPVHDINLRWINKLQDIHSLVGYSGHERGIAITLAAVACNACIVERHFTFNRTMEGPDHAASLLPEEFTEMVKGIRDVEQALGSGLSREMSQGEMINRENLSKSLIASKDLKKGTVIDSTHISIKSPGQGLSPQRFNNLIGHTLKRDMLFEDFFYESDINDNYVSPRQYSFTRPWGIPVRYHDFHIYDQLVKPNLVEFHLSYSDMDIDLKTIFNKKYDYDFVVHAPELFLESHLMDLASPDENYRKKSIFETQRVINITKQLKTFFPNTKKPFIVANIGGFSMDSPLKLSEIKDRYKIFEKSLEELDMSGVELIPQTMAPFPWHFGGQRYQNLFVNIDEIVYWCKKLKLRMCFDLSHSQLMCNHFKQDIYEFTKKIAPITAHIHMGDAKGVNGEGLQIGDGDIDFDKVGEILNKGCPDASFIPEIWQGHKSSGEGFWIALDKLEDKL